MSKDQIISSYDVMIDRIESLVSSIQPLGFNSEADDAANLAKHDVLCALNELRYFNRVLTLLSQQRIGKMRASKLIERLQTIIKEHGDLQVTACGPEGWVKPVDLDGVDCPSFIVTGVLAGAGNVDDSKLEFPSEAEAVLSLE